MAIDIDSVTLLPEKDQKLLRTAQAVAGNSYNAYSGFYVGAAVRGADGSVHRGAFFENRSYGMTICAEPAAILAANSSGVRDLVAIAIVGGGTIDMPDVEDEPCMPCGRCRQILQEVAAIGGHHLLVYSSNLSLSRIRLTTSDELLPFAF